jgi:hypothetical protein
MTKWRPSDWKYPEWVSQNLYCIFDDGADAMLESLRSSPNSLIVPGDRKVHVKEEDGCSFAFIIKEKGVLVFIPDEVK